MEAYQDVYRIEGGTPLCGEYSVKGAKNSALPIMAATICSGGVHEIYGCPHIGDSAVMEEILRTLGAKVHWEKDCLMIDSRVVSGTCVPQEMMEKLRSSVFLMGSLLARYGEATICRPGGCRIGSRPIDIHIQGLRALGFSVVEEAEQVVCKGRCKGGCHWLAYPSVGATENLMMAALSAPSGVTTVLKNCAMEPEIADLQGFLRCCGFRIFGAGESSEILIEGGGGGQEAMYFIMEDRIEAATYMMAAAGTGGDVTLRGIRPELVRPVSNTLRRMGARIRAWEDVMQIEGPPTLLYSPGIVVTAPYPGFPTDCQPQLLTLTAQAEGLTTIREEVFDSRFTHKKELMKMGANIETCGKNAIIKGVCRLQGTTVKAQDLRGGAALVLAGLLAEGQTIVDGIYHIERGYEDFAGGINKLGGKIEKKQRETKEAAQSAAEVADPRCSGCGDMGVPELVNV